MAALSEYIARRSNLEDDCDGRFFGGRFKCREITSDGGLLVGGMYLDLNELRSGQVLTPEDSRNSSVWFRIQARQQVLAGLTDSPVDRWLAPLTLTPDMLGDVPSSGRDRASDKGLLDMTLDEYLKLLDWAGRELRSDKPGAIPADLPPILERLGLKSDKFLEAVEKFERLFPRLVGPVAALQERAEEMGRRWLHGVRPAAELFHEQ